MFEVFCYGILLTVMQKNPKKPHNVIFCSNLSNTFLCFLVHRVDSKVISYNNVIQIRVIDFKLTCTNSLIDYTLSFFFFSSCVHYI